MIQRIFKTLIIILFAFNIKALGNVKIDEPAPDFTLKSSKGETISLSDFRGKYVVLEWVNFDCPFVKKHYDTDNMQKLQEKYSKQGVIWLLICSSAPGKQGHFKDDEIHNRMKNYKTNPYAYLIDEDGTVGKAYGAKTTPDMRIINPDGILIYAGAIDDKATTSKDDVKNARNYVDEALNAALNNKPIKDKVTKPYGCSVKYAN